MNAHRRSCRALNNHSSSANLENTNNFHYRNVLTLHRASQRGNETARRTSQRANGGKIGKSAASLKHLNPISNTINSFWSMESCLPTPCCNIDIHLYCMSVLVWCMLLSRDSPTTLPSILEASEILPSALILCLSVEEPESNVARVPTIFPLERCERYQAIVISQGVHAEGLIKSSHGN